MIRDLLAAGRVANLSTVWSNVLVGAIFAQWFDLSNALFDLHSLLFAGLSGTFLYLGGCFLNDWYDFHWDAQHKPERAAPSGRVPRMLLGTLSLFCLVIGVLCSIRNEVTLNVAFTIVAFITIYTLIHKKTALGMIPMGLSRAGLYVLGIASQAPHLLCIPLRRESFEEYLYVLVDLYGTLYLWAPAIGIACYIAGITIIARGEATNQVSTKTKCIGLFCLIAPLLSHRFAVNLAPRIIYFLATLPFITATVFAHHALKKNQIGKFVSHLLAAICLIDFIIIFPTTFYLFSQKEHLSTDILTQNSICVLLTLLFYLMTKGLQKYAPAT